MKNKNKLIRFALILLASVLLMGTLKFISMSSAADIVHEPGANSEVILKVAGHNILRQDVYPSNETVKEWSYINEASGSNETKEDIVKKLMIRNLKRKIHLILEKALLKKFSIAVSNEEINERVSALQKKYDKTVNLESQKKKLELLVDGINNVFVDHVEPSIVFEKYLKGEIDLGFWKFALKYYATPAKRKELKAQYDRLKNLRKSDTLAGLKLQAEEEINSEKLRRAIFEDISNSNDHIKNVIKLLNKDSVQSNDDANLQLKDAYNKWWKSTFAQEVIVKDKNYDKIVDSLLPLIPYKLPTQK